MNEVSECCGANLVEDFKENFRDHHDPIEIYTCYKCKLECDATIKDLPDDEQFPPRTDEEENFYRRGGKLENY